jgi:curved DNA-binding protein CbpA
MKWFVNVKTVEDLRKRYRELQKKYHPDYHQDDHIPTAS